MAKRAKRMRTYTPAQIRPFAEAIGQVSIAFNDLHEALGLLFAMAATSHNPNDVMHYMQMQAIWGCMDSERAKRAVLIAAVERLSNRFSSWREIRRDVPWIVNRASSLEDQRNNIMHAPLNQMTYGYFAKKDKHGREEIEPATTMLNRRALSLQNAIGPQPLLTEIRKYRTYATKLTGFTLEVFHAWQNEPERWPARPKLPSLKVG